MRPTLYGEIQEMLYGALRPQKAAFLELYPCVLCVVLFYFCFWMRRRITVKARQVKAFKCLTLIFLDTVQPNTRPKETPDTSTRGLNVLWKIYSHGMNEKQEHENKRDEQQTQTSCLCWRLTCFTAVKYFFFKKSTFWINNFQFYKTERTILLHKCAVKTATMTKISS